MAERRKNNFLLLLTLCQKMNANAMLLYQYHKRYRKLLMCMFFRLWSVNNRMFYLSQMRKQLLLTSDMKCCRVWSFPRPQYEFEENFVNEHVGHMYWARNFRMSKNTFLFIVEICKNFMQPSKNYVRQPVIVEKRVAIALLWLATGNSFQSVGSMFGVHKATVQKFVNLFIDGILLLKNDFITFPRNGPELLKSIKTFLHKTKLPHVAGAIDGTHVEISKPQGESAVDYFSRKQKYTIVNQAVCDGNLLFLSIDAGFPGSVHDARMLENSWVYNAAVDREILASPTIVINDFVISPYLLADPAYPIVSWIMKPYAHGTKHLEQKTFNYELSRARCCIERAFGLLKGRWRILLKRIELSPMKASKLFVACCIPHNILQQRGEPESDEVVDDLITDDIHSITVGDGEKKRKFLASYIQQL